MKDFPVKWNKKEKFFLKTLFLDSYGNHSNSLLIGIEILFKSEFYKLWQIFVRVCARLQESTHEFLFSHFWLIFGIFSAHFFRWNSKILVLFVFFTKKGQKSCNTARLVNFKFLVLHTSEKKLLMKKSWTYQTICSPNPLYAQKLWNVGISSKNWRKEFWTAC